MNKYIGITRQVLSMSIQRLVEFRKNFVLWTVVSTAWTVFSLFFYQILFGQSSTIAGWSHHDMYILIGTYMFIDSFTWILFWNPIRMYIEAIFNGTLEFYLIKPADSQFLISMHRISFTNLSRMVIGLYLLFTNVGQISFAQGVLFVVFVLCSLLTIYSIWFFSATWAIWVERLSNVKEVVPALRSVWSVPAEVYSGPIGAILTVAVPLALISSVPAKSLLNQFNFREIAIFVTMAIVTFSTARLFFFHSMKRYASAGS